MINVKIVEGKHAGLVVNLSQDVFESGRFELEDIPQPKFTPNDGQKPCSFIVKRHQYGICHRTFKAVKV